MFRAQGYDETTVEQIAAAAEVSPSTFFRYFPTKEDVVLQDDFDRLWLDAIKRVPEGVSLMGAVRASLRAAFEQMPPEVWNDLQERVQLSLATPAIRARYLEEFIRTADAIAAAIAERTGRDAADSAVRAATGAVLGVSLLAFFDADFDLTRFIAQFDQSLALLEAGLPL